MKDSFVGINAGKGQIDLSNHRGPSLEVRPIEIHLKEDGDLNNNPSLCIVMEYPPGIFYGQLSLKMFNEGLKDIGYKIVKDE